MVTSSRLLQHDQACNDVRNSSAQITILSWLFGTNSVQEKDLDTKAQWMNELPQIQLSYYEPRHKQKKQKQQIFYVQALHTLYCYLPYIYYHISA